MTKKKGQSVRARRAAYEAKKRRRRQLYYGGAALIVVIIVGFFGLVRQMTAPSLEDVVLPEELAAPPNANGKAWGPVDAPVIIQEFSDFQ